MLPVFILIQSIENDEDRSFVERLYTKYNKVMYERAFKILNNQHDAEDAVSTAIENVINNLQDFARSETGAKRMLYIYTKNAAINIYRKNRRDRSYQQVIPYDDYVSGAEEQTTGSVEDIVINNITMKVVLDVVKRLPEAQKDAFYLYYFENYSYEKIAELLGTTADSVGTRLFRAKKAIKEAIDGASK